MKKLIVAAFLTGLSTFVIAQDDAAAKRERFIKATGGYVTKEGSGTGRIAFVNASRMVEASWLRKAVSEIENLLECRMIAVETTAAISIENAEKEVMRNDAAAAVFLVESETLPTLLVAPENDWAFINVSKLTDANKRKFYSRVEKELWRAFGILCGAAESQMGCVLSPVESVKDLDKLSTKYISPQPLGSIRAHLHHIGVTPYLRTTYRNACEQGWAPPPTNEFQKAVWDKVHAIPDKPMKIQFDPATQKGKVTK